MNKAERHRLKMKKYFKRLRNYCLTNRKGDFFSFRSHGSPCSCMFCRDTKFRDLRAKEKRTAFKEAERN